MSLSEAAKKTPVDCVVSNWTAVGSCSASPPYVRKWTRTVLTKPANKGKACPSLKVTVNCKPVDCKMTKWTKWSACRKHGTKTRTRTVGSPAKYGGRACPSRVDTVRCKPKPVDCTLDKHWSEWGPCELNATAFFVSNRTRGVATTATNGGSCPATDDPRRLEMQPCHPDCEKQDTASYDECVRVLSKFEAPRENTMYSGTYTVVGGSVDSEWKCAAACVAVSHCRAYSYHSTVCLVSDGDVGELSDFGPGSVVVSAKLRWDQIPPLPRIRFQWPLATVVALAVCSQTQAAPLYTLEASAIVPVPGAERISATHLFQREPSILTASRSQLPYISLTSEVRGRLFATYDDKPPTDDRVFAKITIAGSSESAVSLIEFPTEVETIYERLTLQPPLSVEIKDMETMLIDIKLYKKNSLKDFNIASGEGMLLENVVYASPNDSSIETVFGWGSGSLFVSDPGLELGGVGLYAYSPNGTFQAEVGQINATTDQALVNLPRRGNVKIVANQVWGLRVSSTDEAGRANSKLCVSSTTAVNVTYDVGEYIDLNAGNRTVIPSGVVCTKLPLPERATTQIGGGGGESDATKDAAKGTTSSANALVSVGGVAALLLAALM